MKIPIGRSLLERCVYGTYVRFITQAGSKNAKKYLKLQTNSIHIADRKGEGSKNPKILWTSYREAPFRCGAHGLGPAAPLPRVHRRLRSEVGGRSRRVLSPISGGPAGPGDGLVGRGVRGRQRRRRGHVAGRGGRARRRGQRRVVYLAHVEPGEPAAATSGRGWPGRWRTRLGGRRRLRGRSGVFCCWVAIQ